MMIPFRKARPSQTRLRELAEVVDQSALPECAPELRQFARKEAPHQNFRERRRDRRYSLITNVIAVPIDGRFRASAEPFVALSSGMSTSGLRLIHTGPAPAELLFLGIEGQPVKFLLEVLRSQPVGECFEIAGRLIKADFKNPRRESPIVCSSHHEMNIAALGPIAAAPTPDDVICWAGVTAAMPLLLARCETP